MFGWRITKTCPIHLIKITNWYHWMLQVSRPQYFVFLLFSNFFYWSCTLHHRIGFNLRRLGQFDIATLSTRIEPCRQSETRRLGVRQAGPNLSQLYHLGAFGPQRHALDHSPRHRGDAQDSLTKDTRHQRHQGGAVSIYWALVHYDEGPQSSMSNCIQVIAYLLSVAYFS